MKVSFRPSPPISDTISPTFLISALRKNDFFIAGKPPKSRNRYLHRSPPPLCPALCTQGINSLVPCSDCDEAFPFIHVADSLKSEGPGNENYARSSLPCFLSLRSSLVPGGGWGVFTGILLPAGLIFGPFIGPSLIKSGVPLSELTRMNPFSWTLRSRTEQKIVLDGSNPRTSNWLRYVNSARYREEQNLVAVMEEKGSVFYMTAREIGEGEELLVFYGMEYLRLHLGYAMPLSFPLAPPKSRVKCPSCFHWDGADPHEAPQRLHLPVSLNPSYLFVIWSLSRDWDYPFLPLE